MESLEDRVSEVFCGSILVDLKSLVDTEDIPPWFRPKFRRLEQICVEMIIFGGNGIDSVKFRVVRLFGGILGSGCSGYTAYVCGYRFPDVGERHLMAVRSLCEVIKSRDFGLQEAAMDVGCDEPYLIGTSNFSVNCDDPKIIISGILWYDLNYGDGKR